MIAITTRLLGYTTAGAALLALATGIWGVRVDHLRAAYKDKWQAAEKTVKDVRAEYAVFRTAIVDRTAEALAAQKAVNQARENELKEIADEADSNLADLRARLRAALLRRSTAGGSGGGPAADAAGDSAGVSETMSAPTAGVAGSVSISIETLTGLAAYAIKAHDWAVTVDRSNTPEK